MPISTAWKIRGEKAREARETIGLRQLDIANLIGKTISTVSDFERGRKRLNLDELQIISKVLKIDLNNF